MRTCVMVSSMGTVKGALAQTITQAQVCTACLQCAIEVHCQHDCVDAAASIIKTYILDKSPSCLRACGDNQSRYWRAGLIVINCLQTACIYVSVYHT